MRNETTRAFSSVQQVSSVARVAPGRAYRLLHHSLPLGSGLPYEVGLSREEAKRKLLVRFPWTL